MRSTARPASQNPGPSRAAMPMRRYAHPIVPAPRPSAVISREGIEWIYAALYAQSLALEEIRSLLEKGNNL